MPMDELTFEAVVMAAADGMRKGTWDWGEEGREQLNDFLYNECVRAIMAVIEAGFAIVPTASVPTPEQRAAVGRLVDLEQARIDMRVAASRGSSQSDWDAANTSWHAAKESIQPGDIEAARAFAEGGK